jgi:hypothetical protein
MDAEAYDHRLRLARKRRYAFLCDGFAEPFGHLRARAPRSRRLLAQAECDGQTRLGRDPCRTPQVLLQTWAGEKSDDFHVGMACPESKRSALPLREPDICPWQIVVDDALHARQIEPFGRDIGREQDVRSRERRWWR